MRAVAPAILLVGLCIIKKGEDVNGVECAVMAALALTTLFCITGGW